ncbi:hypothetical protein FISHEDRAFT_60301 [Fistulina hepatica ATCC 64428]|uniref:DUF6535 domain-containing protein n=1 Tax=Fistulina hepatica ATCC 64428 TaxID=1128425 RepID=A0A0D7A6U9_9AGAR|nr:hypothetical protein FISHEDRAFT_60301 [Fistulina hepatica ATCC 64428]
MSQLQPPTTIDPQTRGDRTNVTARDEAASPDAMSSHSDSQKPESPGIEGMSREMLQDYMQRSFEHDVDLVHRYDRRLDGQLLFNGVFSAITTPLIAETYQLLEKKRPDTAAIVMNAMFFGALIISLCCAVMALHCKQWLDSYERRGTLRRHSARSTTPTKLYLERAGSDNTYAFFTSSVAVFSHHPLQRYDGVKRFQLAQAVNGNSLLIYISLVCFSIGLVTFLWRLYLPLAIILACICFMVVLLHFGTTIVLTFSPQSPFRTPTATFVSNWFWSGVHGKRSQIDERENEAVKCAKDALDTQIRDWLERHCKQEQRRKEMKDERDVHETRARVGSQQMER